jgi:hypothetical protein
MAPLHCCFQHWRLVICSQRLGADIFSTAIYTSVRTPQLLHSPPLPPPINTSEDETWTMWRALLSLLLLYIAACCHICFFEGLGLLLVGVVNTHSVMGKKLIYAC